MIRQIFAGLLLVFAVAAGGCNNQQAGGNDGTFGNGERGTGELCGGFAGLKCEAGLYCDFPSKTNCGSGDQSGTCTEPPGACTKIFAPVCGCDGKTYGNACEASSASVSVRHTGECGLTGAPVRR